LGLSQKKHRVRRPKQNPGELERVMERGRENKKNTQKKEREG
jgi:hypothetical protein